MRAQVFVNLLSLLVLAGNLTIDGEAVHVEVDKTQPTGGLYKFISSNHNPSDFKESLKEVFHKYYPSDPVIVKETHVQPIKSTPSNLEVLSYCKSLKTIKHLKALEDEFTKLHGVVKC